MKDAGVTAIPGRGHRGRRPKTAKKETTQHHRPMSQGFGGERGTTNHTNLTNERRGTRVTHFAFFLRRKSVSEQFIFFTTLIRLPSFWRLGRCQPTSCLNRPAFPRPAARAALATDESEINRYQNRHGWCQPTSCLDGPAFSRPAARAALGRELEPLLSHFDPACGPERAAARQGPPHCHQVRGTEAREHFLAPPSPARRLVTEVV